MSHLSVALSASFAMLMIIIFDHAAARDALFTAFGADLAIFLHYVRSQP